MAGCSVACLAGVKSRLKLEEEEESASEMSSPRLESPEKEIGARGFRRGAQQQPAAVKEDASEAEQWTNQEEPNEVGIGPDLIEFLRVGWCGWSTSCPALYAVGPLPCKPRPLGQWLEHVIGCLVRRQQR